MGYNQAVSAYRETSVKTASPGKLVVMLYDEAIRQLGIALSLFSAQEKIKPVSIEKYNAAIVKTQEIITELMVSLDMDSGGEIAHNLLALYVYFNQELLDANISRNRKKITTIRDLLSELRDAWASAAATSPVRPAPVLHTNIDING